MPRFDANCSNLLGELPFLDRFERAAAAAAFDAVECLFACTRVPGPTEVAFDGLRDATTAARRP